MPQNNTCCPFTGLKRGMLYNLCVPCKANSWKPPVQSKVIKGKTAQRKGARLINKASLLAYIESVDSEES